MNKSTLSTLIAAATLAVSGIAFAQTTANPPTSTPGAGCTATANAMKGGNLGGSPSDTACTSAGARATAAAAPAPATTAAATTDATPMANSSAKSSSMGAAPAKAAPMRVARADRN